MSVLSTLLATVNLSACVMTAACNGGLQSEQLQTAVMLPREDVYSMYLDKGKVEDYNGDGIPEVYLTAGSGWNYFVCYYLDGEMRTVEGLEPWAWSSDLCITEDGHLVLYTWPHTMGTAGNYNYRIYEWTDEGYCLAEELWSEPDEYDWEEGTVLSCKYFSSKTALDPFAPHEGEGEEVQISQEEYERRIENLGKMTSVFEDGLTWGWEFWQENEYEDDSVKEGIYREIQDQILNWHG